MPKLSNNNDDINDIRASRSLRVRSSNEPGISNKTDKIPQLPNELICVIISILWNSLEPDDATNRIIAFHASATCKATYYLRPMMMITMHETSIDEASRKGYIALLDWWRWESGLTVANLSRTYTTNAITFAARNNRVDVLDWWKLSGLALKFNAETIYSAATREVLVWWKRNKMPFLYAGKSPVDVAVASNRWDIIEWWIKGSEQPVVFTGPTVLFEHKKLLHI